MNNLTHTDNNNHTIQSFMTMMNLVNFSLPSNSFNTANTSNTANSSNKVTLLCATFDPLYFSADFYECVTFNEPEHIQSAVLKRRAEFFAGRFIAAKILRQLGAKSVALPIGTHRNPIWPEGYIGSISHSNQVVMVAAALQNDIQLLGIDCEKVMQRKVAEKIFSQVASEEELACFTKLNIPFETAITLIFSAKEAVFKAIYPKIEKYINFDSSKIIDVSIDASARQERGRFKVRLDLLQINGSLPKYLIGEFNIVTGKVFVMTIQPR